MKNSKLSKVSISIGLFFNVILILACGYVGLTTPHRIPALVLMACAGFFVAILFITLVFLWFPPKPQGKDSYIDNSQKV